ncbi:MAG TPA: CAP domain-containing protein [Gaiellaceae bacterium]|nr:CAP domain-containing protein [Gaiellaceae bacterium]
MLVALVGVVAAPTAAPAPVQRQQSVEVLDAGVLDGLNAIRQAHGLEPLRPSASLVAAAEFHSHELAAVGYFAHASADGGAFWKRIERWYEPRASGTWEVGENLLWCSPDIDARRALRTWMASPAHRANILGGDWREIGIAAIHVASAGGVYGGRPVTIITADFGART